jgi:type I restriction enzyme S subunit
MSEWKKYKLSEFIEINPKVTLNSGIQHSFVEMKDLNESRKYVIPSQLKAIKGGARFQNSDTLFARITPCLQNGKICQVQGLKNSVGFGSTEFLVFRGKDGISNTDFIYYLSRYDVVRKFAEQNMIGTSGRQRVSKDAFANLELYLPELSTQTAIAEILSSLDNKIEINNKINQELETLAQTLFKQWFIDFEFPNENGEPYKSSGGQMVESALGEIPKGWALNDIESLTEKMNSGGTPSTRREDYYDGNIKWFSTKELKDSFLFESERMISQAGLDNSSAKIFPLNTVVMAIYAAPTVGRLGILTEDATFNQAALGFTAKEEVGFEFIFLLLKHLRIDLNNLANGAAQQNLNVGLVKKYRIIYPSLDILTFFKQLVSPLFSSIKINQQEILTLKSTRDTLLPKLISGELEINEISN